MRLSQGLQAVTPEPPLGEEELQRLRSTVATLAVLLEETAANVDLQPECQAHQDVEDALRRRAEEAAAAARTLT